MIEGQILSTKMGNEVRVQRRVKDITITVSVEQDAPNNGGAGRPLPHPSGVFVNVHNWLFLTQTVSDAAERLAEAVTWGNDAQKPHGVSVEHTQRQADAR